MLACADVNALAGKFLEALDFGIDVVVARAEKERVVLSGFFGLNAGNGVGVSFGDDDGDAGDIGASGVDDCAADGAAELLGQAW